MTILKILNNNVIVTRNENDREIVAMGRGIAFQKKPGDKVDSERIDKIYALSDQSTFSKFQAMLAEIPMEYMLLSERIIDYAKNRLGNKLNDCIYITLPDHISTAIARYKENIVLENPLLWDIRRFYPDEFEVGLKANQIVLEETGVKFIEDEAAFITLHFINAELNSQMKNVYGITKIMQEVCTMVKDYFHMEFDESSLNYYRFINHVKFFAQRLLSGSRYKDGDDDLLEVIQFKYKEAFQCAEQIKQMIFSRYNYDLGKEELLYLTIHISRITQKS
ncbi:Transcription antiterminator LicT [Caprobacter fermentans]|uniref:PRD domain-containing protein n=1 Tax=Caproicibacter fermentans TaxID=2576756 RepID=A0A6N8I3L7_9FIRM|nr:PRD domain-containing protein [Caproicibacter fermentans]MVB12548.1 Transcription antiterminator LicT [Caproicibacter fermentans]OCN00048.1 transcription antiterminator LicT [Clostridium sp. W14A]QNK39122.1 PRD domain-containing protein [Caproicibacter fermentans]